VTLALAGSYDFSGLTFGSTLSDGAAGLDITGSGGDDTIVGTSGADVITTATGTHVITGGEGADEIDITVGTKSTVVIADGDTGVTANNVDVITAFTSGTDKLKLGTAGSATNFAEVDATDGISDGTGAADTVAQALAAVTGDGTLDGTVKYAFVFDSDDAHTSGWLVIDFDADGEADGVVELVGLVATGDLVFGDIIA
jgi:Ca2+-binding RTX toxin-like protein